MITGIWKAEADTEIINVADLDYDRPDVLTALTIGIGRPDFQPVAEVDFAGPSHARAVDASRFADRLPYAVPSLPNRLHTPAWSWSRPPAPPAATTSSAPSARTTTPR